MKNKFIVVTLFFVLISISKTNLAARLENVLLWNNSTIPFEIDQKFTFEETNKIIDALNEMMLQINIVFIKHRPGQIENYIVYTKADPRNEYIETHGGKGGISLTGYGRFPLPVSQPINFWSVSIGTVKHETMHALGFNHEQCRSDRDNFITVNHDNIKPEWEINFLILPGGRNIGDYDFNSIMHYSSNSGGKTETSITMERKSPAGDISFGDAKDFSPTDIFAINSVYPFRPVIRTRIPGISFMAVGERRTVRVEANKEYNFFTIPVGAGQVYRIDAFNRDKWKPAIGGSSYTADGVRQGGCKRVPGNKFMRMLCDIYTIEENNASNFTGYRFAINTDNNNITEFTVQANGEGFLMFYANDCPGTYLDNSGSIGVHVERFAPPAEAFDANENWTDNPYFGSRGTFFADVTGDGKADAIVSNESGIAVRASSGIYFGQRGNWTDNKVSGNKGTFFADVDGDGKADLITVNVNSEVRINSTFVRRSTGNVFAASDNWSSNLLYGSKGTFFTDVTGDGKADAVIVETTGVKVFRSTGTGFSAAENWTTGPYFGNAGTFFSDVTGDGKADAIVVNDWGVTVRRSTGTLFSPNETWTANPYLGDAGNFFADVTGDGKADAIVVNVNGVTVRRSNGSVFLANETGTSNPYLADKGIFFSDVKGTGKCAAIVVNNSNIVVRPAH